MDPYLTNRFEAITHAKFGVDVNIRDCRSIYVNYAKDHLNITQMYELSRQMCHSFNMQQSQYRADDSVDRAIRSLQLMDPVTDMLAISNGIEETLPLPPSEQTANDETKEDQEDVTQPPDDGFDEVEEDSITNTDELEGLPTLDALLGFVERYNKTHEDKI
jgi:hypothetical protein